MKSQLHQLHPSDEDIVQLHHLFHTIAVALILRQVDVGTAVIVIPISLLQQLQLHYMKIIN